MNSDEGRVEVTAVDSRFRRQATLALAGAALFALLGFGAVATTFAADPSPSPSAGVETPAPDSEASPKPEKRERGDHRGFGGTRGGCPDKDGSGGDDGSDGDSREDATPAPSDDQSASPEA